MAWKSVKPMDERIRFVLEAELGLWPMSQLCQRYGISRKTGYKWLKRYKTGGLEAMYEQSRTPKHCPHRTGKHIEDAIVDKKKKHPKWGPKKIAELLSRDGVKVPAASTIGRILKDHKMVKQRKKRRAPVKRWPAKLTFPRYPNHVWGVDFKGWFRTADGARCDPLTISDLYSRFVLGCEALKDQAIESVWPIFEQTFKRYGLPQIIRVDNGSPFASQGPLGLSKLSVWWIQLGICIEFIEPGHPEQNSIHERMHKTLKQEATCPPATNLIKQQSRFKHWQRQFNFQRPHESLAMQFPAEVYEPSASKYAAKTAELAYPAWFERRLVNTNGRIVFESDKRFIGGAFAGVHVGLEPIGAEHYLVHCGPLVLGALRRGCKQPMELTIDLHQLKN